MYIPTMMKCDKYIVGDVNEGTRKYLMGKQLI